MYSLCRDINNCSVKAYVFSSLFPVCPFYSSFQSFSVALMLFFLCVCQMGLLCGQVCRQETGSSRYCVHMPLCIQSDNLSLFPLKGQYRGYKLPPCGQSEVLLSLCCTVKRYQIVKLRLELEVWTYYLFLNSHHSAIAVFQVNGTLVTHSNHIEVVKLIKCKFFSPCSPLRHISKSP